MKSSVKIPLLALKKILIIAVCGIFFFSILTFSACMDIESAFHFSMGGNSKTNVPGQPHESAKEETEVRLTADSDKIAVFSSGGSSQFSASHWSNGGIFNCMFSRNSAYYADGYLNLNLSKGDRYYGAEVKSNNWYHYGYYSVSMKAADCSGVVSSFFTYRNGPWDEIDIEFLGKDMTGVQFNYYTNGVGRHEYFYKLGFDASASFHEYGFLWEESAITWYVDGVAVYKATENIPTTAGQIMMNIWNPISDYKNWVGPLNDSGLPVTASYEWVGYRAL